MCSLSSRGSSRHPTRAERLRCTCGRRGVAGTPVYERAWLVVADGEVDVTTADEERVSGGPRRFYQLRARNERRTVQARSDARLLLLLAPWPGEGHPVA